MLKRVLKFWCVCSLLVSIMIIPLREIVAQSNLLELSSLLTLEWPNTIYDVAWSFDGSYLASMDEIGSVTVWETEDWQIVHTVNECGGGNEPLAWSPIASTLVVGCYLDSYLQMEVINQDLTVVLIDTEHQSPAWSSNGNQLAVPQSDETIDILNADFETLYTLGTSITPDPLSGAEGAAYVGFKWSPTGDYLAAIRRSQFDFITIWDLNIKQEIRDFIPASDLMWSDNGNTFTLTIQDYNTETGSLQTWETATFQMLSSTPIPFNFNAEPIIEGSPDESYLTYCVRGEPLELYDTNSQQLITLITPTGVDIICPLDDIAWSPNNLLAIASHQIPITEEETGGTITIWVINTGSLDDCTSSPTTVTDLIAAITDANGTSEADTICLTDSTYTFTTAHIPLNALPAITSEITIIGNGAALSRQAGSPLFGFFEVSAGGNLTLENLTLNGGDVGNDTGGALVNEGRHGYAR